MDDFEHHLEAIKSIAPREIAVVASIDVEPLTQALGMVLREVNNQSQIINNLKADQERALEREEALRKKLETLEAALNERKSDTTNPDTSVDAFEQRLAALEKEQPIAALPVASPPLANGRENENGLSQTDMVSDLEGRVSALEDALKSQSKEALPLAAPPSSAQEADGGGVSKEDFDNLVRRLNDKADRSELDAILSSPPAADNGEDEASNANGGGAPDIESLRNLIRVLGERVNKKADQRALDDANAQIDGVKGRFSPLKAQIDTLEAALGAQRKAVNDIGSRVDVMEPDLKLVGQEMRSSVSELKQEIEELKRRLQSGGHPSSPSLNGVSSDTGLAELVRDMQVSLKSKVDGKDLAHLSDKLNELAVALEDLKRKVPAESKADLSSLVADIAGLKDSLSGIKDDFASKADASKLSSLALETKSALAEGLAPKADRSDLEDLKLRLSLMNLSPASGDNGEGGGDGRSEGILEAIKAMLGDKADKADLNALRDAVAAKTAQLEELCDDLATRLAALRDVLQEVRAAPSSSTVPLAPLLSPEVLDGKTNKADFDDLAGQVGDIFAELQRIKSQRERDLASGAPQLTAQAAPVVAKQPQDNVTSSALLKDVEALVKDVLNLKGQVEMTSHAINTLAVGLEPRSNGNAAAIDPSSGGAGKEPRDAAGAYERLVKHVGSQSIKKKMDWFDPNVLNDLSVKAAAMDTFLRSPAFNRMGAPDLGLKDLEAQVKKLSLTVKQLKAAAPLQASGRLADPGDHAILSGKPLMGYRCLACDRPLEGLDERPGPYVPTSQAMTGRQSFPTIPSGGVGGGGGIGSPPPMSPDRGTPPRPGTVDTSQVGPKLPPGGWRASQAGGSGSGMTYTRVSQTGEPGLPRI